MASLASKFKFDLRIDIRNLNHPGVHVHFASDGHFGGYGSLQMTSEVKTDFKIELSNLIYLYYHASLPYKGFLKKSDQLSSIDFARLPPDRNEVSQQVLVVKRSK